MQNYMQEQRIALFKGSRTSSYLLEEYQCLLVESLTCLLRKFIGSQKINVYFVAVVVDSM